MAKSPSATRVKAAESALRRRPEAGTCPPEAPSSRPWCGSRLLCHGVCGECCCHRQGR